MNKVLDKLPALVVEELEAANAENPPFHSLHEGWAVLKEEVEEAREDCDDVEFSTRQLWAAIRGNHNLQTELSAKKLSKQAQSLAAEAIQVAAMAEKLLDYINAKREATL